MATAVRISDQLASKAKLRSRVMKRSVSGQIEYWAKIGELVEENPELPFHFIQELLIGKVEAEEGELTAYQFGEE